MTANYTFGKASHRPLFHQRGAAAELQTLRDKSLEWGPTGYDLRHIFQVYGTYDLPFGDGRRYDFQNGVVEQVLGGWALSAIVRMQSGRPFLLQSGRQTLNQE